MRNIFFGLESFRRHMDNGRILCQRGMEHQGWVTVGADCPSPEVNNTDVRWAVERFNPKVVLFFPRYEWDFREWIGPEVKPEHCFHNWEFLLQRPGILRVTVWHDAGSARVQQQRWHEAFQPHVYLSWYHQQSVMPFAPYVERGNITRTYHVLDTDNLPPVEDRSGVAVVSGAYTHDVYPLRTKCFQWAAQGLLGPGVDAARHPGYAQAGTKSNEYAAMFGRYKVAICTASAYKFALRKIFEATAMGCKIITNLPSYDYLPGIDDNLIRIPDDISVSDMKAEIEKAAATWDLEQQQYVASVCRHRYDWRLEYNRVSVILNHKREEVCQSTT
jgi:hypothetical protein